MSLSYHPRFKLPIPTMIVYGKTFENFKIQFSIFWWQNVYKILSNEYFPKSINNIARNDQGKSYDRADKQTIEICNIDLCFIVVCLLIFHFTLIFFEIVIRSMVGPFISHLLSLQCINSKYYDWFARHLPYVIMNNLIPHPL